MLGNCTCFLSAADCFQNKLFSKYSFRNIIRVSQRLDPDQARQMLGMIWVQTVCKGYQQTALVGKELKVNLESVYCLFTLYN